MTGHGATVAEQEQGQPDDGAAGPCECDVVIRHGYIITMNPDRAVYADGAVAVFGREIVMVGTDQYYAAWYHVMSPEDEHAGAQISGLELLRSGVTCFMEPGTAFDTDAVADAVVGVGIRASLSEPFLWDISEDPMLGSMRRSPGTAQRCGELLGRELWRNAADGLVRVLRPYKSVFLTGTGGLLDDQGWRTAAAVGSLFGRWDQTAGQDLAAPTRPGGVTDGELVVIADSTAWATQVRLLAATLIRRLNEELGNGTVIRVKVHGPTPPRRSGPWRVRDGRGPRGDYG